MLINTYNTSLPIRKKASKQNLIMKIKNPHYNNAGFLLFKTFYFTAVTV